MRIRKLAGKLTAAIKKELGLNVPDDVLIPTLKEHLGKMFKVYNDTKEEYKYALDACESLAGMISGMIEENEALKERIKQLEGNELSDAMPSSFGMNLSSYCVEAVEHWGQGAQVNMAKEEAAELITALSHHERGRAKTNEVITEIADNVIMCNQLALIFGYVDVMEEVNRKIERARLRIANEGGQAND